MYGVLREYEVGSSAIDALVRRAGETFVPLLCTAPGFVSFTMMEDAEVQALVTLSTFEDPAGAQESIRLAADWVKDQVLPLLPRPPRHTIGRFAVRIVRDTGDCGYFALRRYTIHPGNVAPFAHRVCTDLVPSLRAAPGFAGYAVLDAGHGRMVSLSAFADLCSATDANAEALSWVRTHLGGLIRSQPEVSTAEVKLHTERAVAGVR